jgi:hypothetical protein
MGCVGRAKFRPITGLCLKVARSIVISKASRMEKKYLPLREVLICWLPRAILKHCGT